MHRRFSLLAALTSCLAFSTNVVSAAWARAREAIDWFVSLAVDVLSRPTMRAPTFGRAAFAGGPVAYDAPSVHFLRHEAGTSQRAAPRNI